MSTDFKELDYQETPLGAISLRRRAEVRLGGKIVYEVKLDDEFLMSSLFTEAEVQLATLALAELSSFEGTALDVVVGGLGLGYTAVAALADASVGSLVVVEVMAPVIDWHRRGIVPNADALCSDPRTTLLHGDFFAMAAADEGFDPADPDKKSHAILLDIDHSPSHWLNPQNSSAYTVSALAKMAEKLHPGGVFGLWSNDPPEPAFERVMGDAFASAHSHVVTFANPYTRGESANTVYIART